MAKKTIAPRRRVVTQTLQRRSAPKKPVTKKTPAAPAQSASIVRVPRVVPEDEVTLVPSAGLLPALSDQVQLGSLGFQLPDITEQESAVIRRPVNPDLILIKPTGQAYLSHPAYADWLDDAFGVGRWVMRPVSKPNKVTIPGVEKQKKNGGGTYRTRDRDVVHVDYVLFIKGVPSYHATGEHEYHPDSPEQTYGDAIESTRASAIRRIAKQLGMGRAMWDRAYLNAWAKTHAVCVAVKDGNYTKTLWRRKVDDPFPGEVGTLRGPTRAPAGSGPVESEARPPQGYANAKATDPVSEAQVVRLVTIATKHHVTDEQIKTYLAKTYPYTVQRSGVASKKLIKRQDYNDVVAWVEAGGPAADALVGEVLTANDIPWGVDREPGSDDDQP